MINGLATFAAAGALLTPWGNRAWPRLREIMTVGVVLVSTLFAACRVSGDEGRLPAHANAAPILVFNGTGTSPGDVAALEKILSSEHLNYSTANSPQLNGISESQLREYRLLIVPGGNFESIGNSLTSTTTAKYP